MRPNRDAGELAARLGAAAKKPVPLPELDAESHHAERREVQTSKVGKLASDTVGMTLRPARALLKRYTLAAAERTKQKGRVVSAQEIMLEVLERGA
jgi:hypothetical protein